jgi:hypothetical protein
MVAIILAICAAWWQAVRTTPWVLAMLVPRRVTLAIGLFFLGTALLSGFLSAFYLRDQALLIGSIIHGFVGSFLLLAPFAGRRGSREHEDLVLRTGIMLAAVVAVLVLSLYVRAPWGQGFLLMWLVLFGGGLALQIPRIRGRN